MTRYLSVRIENQNYKELTILGVLLQQSLSSIVRESLEDFKVKHLDLYLKAEEIADSQRTINVEELAA